MGLDTTYDCWNGGYSSFNIWRDKLAEVAGYKMENFDGKVAPSIDWDNITVENLNGDWENDPDDMLLILIAHYDCQGYIRHKHTKPLADRLTQLIPLLPYGGGPGHVLDWKWKTKTFIAGLMEAHESGEDVGFY